MIPPDVATHLRLAVPEQPEPTQPVAAVSKAGDVLSKFAPGQHLMAEIQAVLPNGTYRALVAQREITLALPFTAKPGDSLELEVQESGGQLTLVATNDRNGGATKSIVQASVSTSLSQTGKLIASLIASNAPQEGNIPSVSLNGSQALVESMPDTAANLAPILKQAITESGMFYEAHQAKWVAGELSTSALRQEPQGKIPVPLPQGVASDTAAVHGGFEAKTAIPELQWASSGDRAQATNDSLALASGRQNAAGFPENVLTIVRQQLEGLANSNFTWQGQIWPGQQMQWEIGEAPEQRTQSGTDEQRVWQSRLKLELPSLGTIDATLRLQGGNQLALEVGTGSMESEAHLRAHAEQLANQFTAIDLNLIKFSLGHESPEN